MFDDTYRNRTVLITGHTGFKGAWLAIWLRMLGADVVGYALPPPSEPSLFQAAGLQSRITHIDGDVRDPAGLIDTLSAHRPEFVFHLAAQPLVRLSYDEPKLTFDTNVGGTVNLLEAVRQSRGVRVVVNVTSDKCYENRDSFVGFREGDPLGGRDPYSASKGCSELVFGAYLRSFFSGHPTGDRVVGAASARAGNVVGGGDWGRDRLVPDCIRALVDGRPIGIRNPDAIRPWQHVLDALAGYLQLGAALWREPRRYGGAWNFGPDDRDRLTVAELTEALIDHWGGGSWHDQSAPLAAPHEARILRLNCDKARARLNWRPLFTIRECLRLTAEWYGGYYRDPRETAILRLCVAQIRRYMAGAAGRIRDTGAEREALRA